MRPEYICKINGKTLTPVKVPAQQTLNAYGLTYRRWRTMLTKQEGVCAICRTIPGSGRLVIDHEHVPKWKRMSPEQRVLYVRGLLCSTCNHYILTRYGTPAKFRAAAFFLEEFEKRRPK